MCSETKSKRKADKLHKSDSDAYIRLRQRGGQKYTNLSFITVGFKRELQQGRKRDFQPRALREAKSLRKY